MIYLDNNATAQPHPEVIEAVRECLVNNWQNPSAHYASAKAAHEVVEKARESVAALVGAHPDEIVFTSGGTEATNTVLNTWIHGRNDNQMQGRNERNGYGSDCAVIATLTTEHPATLRTLEAGRQCGKCATLHVEVDRRGLPLIDVWEEALQDATGATFCMANNETGVIVPTETLVNICRRYEIPVHVDAVQAVGKMPLNLDGLGVDYASLSSHKIHGPKGVGAMFVRRGMSIQPLIYGGGQEGGYRSGTTNVPGIVGFGAAARIALEHMQERIAYVSYLRNKFEMELLKHIPRISINGHDAPRLPNTSNITFEGCPSEGMMLLLEIEDICCSVASACKAGNHTPSSVLTAMGLDSAEAKSSLRFSFSSMNTEEEVDRAIEVIVCSVNSLREVQSSHSGPVIVYKP